MTIAVEGCEQQWQVHKLMLASASPIFRQACHCDVGMYAHTPTTAMFGLPALFNNLLGAWCWPHHCFFILPSCTAVQACMMFTRCYGAVLMYIEVTLELMRSRTHPPAPAPYPLSTLPHPPHIGPHTHPHTRTHTPNTHPHRHTHPTTHETPDSELGVVLLLLQP